jgi:hypothetical protein
MECSHDCTTCSSQCGVKCPICGAAGIVVPSDTVKNLTQNNIDKDKIYFICTNPKCDIVYFDENYENLISTKNVLVPIWYKSDFFNYVVCYCRNIFLRDIIRAVFSLDNPTKENIIKFLEKDKIETNCLLNNPIGKSCDLLFENSIEYAIDLKKQS